MMDALIMFLRNAFTVLAIGLLIILGLALLGCVFLA